MAIQEQLQADLKTAMRAGERQRVDVIRMTQAAIKTAQMEQVKNAFDQAVAANPNAEDVAVDRNAALSEEQVIAVLKKEVKRRRDSADIYRTNKRPDLADTEEQEAALIEAYLPAQLSAADLRPQIAAAITEIGASNIAELGKVMPQLMARFKSVADGKLISQLAREILGGK